MFSNGCFSIWYKMLEKHLWNNLLLNLVVETLQLVHKIAVCPWKCSEKRLKIHRETQETVIHRCSVKRKDVLKNLAQLTAKHLFQSLFFNKVAGWKPESFRSSQWRCCANKVLLKISQIAQELTCVGVSF